MEALGKEPLSSDSEDEDYVPPEVKEPTLSLKKRSGGLQLESDDEDDDDDDDDLSDAADLIDAEIAQLHASTGAGPSTAGAASSSAGAGPSSAGAGSSSAATGPSSANIASGSGAGSSPVGESGAGASVNAATGSSVTVDPAVTADASAITVKDTPVAENSAKPAEQASPADANDAPGAKVEEPIAKKPRVEAPTENKSVDDIWADMNAGVKQTKQATTTTDAGLAAWLEPAQPAKKEFKVTRLSDLENVVQQEEPVTKQNGRTGLEGVLDVVRGKSETVIDKTKKQWKEFKKDGEVNDELEKYKKDKNRYTDKVAFLQRSDVREWEFEQRGKKRR